MDKKSANPKEERASKASLVFMVFGLALVFGSLFLVHSKKNQISQSSLSKVPNTTEPVNSIAMKKKIEGLEINNQRMSAEVYKNQELLILGRKVLKRVDPQDLVTRDLELSSEPNNQLHIHDRVKDERDSYPDVFVQHELELDHQAFDQAVIDEKRDRAYVIDALRKRAAAQNFDMKYDPATGDVTIDRIPQNDSNGGSSK